MKSRAASTLDGDYDIARRLSEAESPPLLGTLLGQDKVLIVSGVSNSAAYAPVAAALKDRGAVRKDPDAVKDEDIKNGFRGGPGQRQPRPLHGCSAGARDGEAAFSAVGQKEPLGRRGRSLSSVDARDRAEAEAAPGQALLRRTVRARQLFHGAGCFRAGPSPPSRG